MKVTVEWLRDFVDTDAGADEIGDVLTMLGIELEGIEDSLLGQVLDFKVTPNRGDCLSVLGIARELCAKDVTRFRPTGLMVRLSSPTKPGSGGSRVVIEDEKLCPRYAAQLLRGIGAGASSEKVAARLTAAGMRPISVLVDTTNYVMLELGQPLHAFDLDKLREQRIVVRTARPGEKLKTLDGVNRELQHEMLMICDSERPVAIAGVMGGEESEVGPSTQNLLLESAHFDPVSVRKTRRTLGMSTEASYRFERYVDPDGVVRAVQRFVDLLMEQTSVEEIGELIDAYANPPTMPTVNIRGEKWNRLLGTDVPMAAAASGLLALGCKVTDDDGALTATPPSWRNDLKVEEDMIEEIGRLWGYERIPEALPSGSTPQGGESAEAALRTRLRDAMVRIGFTEVQNHTLRDRSPLDPQVEPIELRNPAAPELAFLRRSLLPGLAETAARNRGRSLALFEVGRVFADGKEGRSIGFLISGRLYPPHWKKDGGASADLFAAKGVVEEALSLVGRRAQFAASEDERFHPTKQAKIEGIGVIGEVNALIAEELDLPPGSFLGEMNIDAIQSMEEIEPVYKPLSHLPPIRRDIAILIDKSVPYGDVERVIREQIGDTLEDVHLFDVYEGKGIEPGKHSLAIAMIMRHPTKTLTDEEANQVRERVLRELERMGATPR